MSPLPFRQTIRIHSEAPSKPAQGGVCNGCGLCCLAEPCPLGVVLSRSRSGACHALRWDDVALRYRCGAMVNPVALLRQLFPPGLSLLAYPLGSVLGRLAGRWIAAGMGCDSSIEAEDPHASATMQ